MADGNPRGGRFSNKLKRTWAYQTETGSSQVLKYLADTHADSRKKMNALIAHVDQHGRHPSPTRYRPVEGSLVEYKVKNPRAIRVLAHRLPNEGHLLLLGFDKIDGPIPAQHLKRARQMISAFEKGGMQLD